jgi:hypothetical protein
MSPPTTDIAVEPKKSELTDHLRTSGQAGLYRSGRTAAKCDRSCASKQQSDALIPLWIPVRLSAALCKALAPRAVRRAGWEDSLALDGHRPWPMGDPRWRRRHSRYARSRDRHRPCVHRRKHVSRESGSVSARRAEVAARLRGDSDDSCSALDEARPDGPDGSLNRYIRLPTQSAGGEAGFSDQWAVRAGCEALGATARRGTADVAEGAGRWEPRRPPAWLTSSSGRR